MPRGRRHAGDAGAAGPREMSSAAAAFLERTSPVQGGMDPSAADLSAAVGIEDLSGELGVLDGGELARLVALNDGQDWLVITQGGYFDGSPGAFKVVKSRVDGKLTLEPIEKLPKELYRPGLLAAVWKGEKPPAR